MWSTIPRDSSREISTQHLPNGHALQRQAPQSASDCTMNTLCFHLFESRSVWRNLPRAHSGDFILQETHVPIPNTTVKLLEPTIVPQGVKIGHCRELLNTSRRAIFTRCFFIDRTGITTESGSSPFLVAVRSIRFSPGSSLERLQAGSFHIRRHNHLLLRPKGAGLDSLGRSRMTSVVPRSLGLV